MSQELEINHLLSKEEKYKLLQGQIKSLLHNEENLVANCANFVAALHNTFQFLWTGIYFVDSKKNTLVLGPFQGPIACTRIALGKGVCGTSWQKKQTIVVEDVHTFEGHIACSSLSNSEIVVPFINKENEVTFVLDIDSEQFKFFDQTDKKYLEEIIQLLK
jgi:L-methionine (R)-S-oxide reductase